MVAWGLGQSQPWLWGVAGLALVHGLEGTPLVCVLVADDNMAGDPWGWLEGVWGVLVANTVYYGLYTHAPGE